MRIGAFLKQSYIDWDGFVTAVVFTKGCNFRCGYCHNPYLVLPELMVQEPDVPQIDVINFLKDRVGWLDGVVITGGEPTIYGDLKQFIIGIKSLGYRVKLDTNGTNPSAVAELLSERLVDYVAMDIKNELTVDGYRAITPNFSQRYLDCILETITFLRQSGVPYGFRTTLINSIHTEKNIQELKHFLRKDEVHVFQEYREGVVVQNFVQQL
ncbi:MAG: anaerobic ribonucleoside-triphosphate reductase activating protein [Bacteroidales bacterium]